MSRFPRFDAASKEFRTTVKGCGEATVNCVRVLRDPSSSDFAAINAMMFVVAIPLMTVPLATGEAIRVFVNKPGKSSRTNL